MTRRRAALAMMTVASLAIAGGFVVAAETPDEPKASEPAMQIQIQQSGSIPSVTPPSDYFTGVVRVDPLADAKEPSRVGIASVTFEPGARTAWHTHPLGQHLYVTAGFGWVQQEGGEVQEIRPGDLVWFPPGVKHWHGATPTTAMSHLAIHESQGGTPVQWMEKVSDEQYHQ